MKYKFLVVEINGGEEFYITIEQLSTMYGFDKKTWRRGLQKLINIGLIKCEEYETTNFILFNALINGDQEMINKFINGEIK